MTKTCSWCGNLFTATGPRPNRSKLCSRACTVAKSKAKNTKVCSLPDCGGKVDSKDLCNKHYKRLQLHGDPNICFRKYGIDTYSGIHNLLWRKFGKASNYPCVDCGLPADEWSYTYGAPDERYNEFGNPWSADPTYYQPRCVSDHRLHDRAMEAIK